MREVSPAGYIRSSRHLTFDVKMDFTRKAQWVEVSNRAPVPETSKYAGAVLCESI